MPEGLPPHRSRRSWAAGAPGAAALSARSAGPPPEATATATATAVLARRSRLHRSVRREHRAGAPDEGRRDLARLLLVFGVALEDGSAGEVDPAQVVDLDYLHHDLVSDLDHVLDGGHVVVGQ